MSQSHPIRWRNIAFVFVLLLLAGLVIVTMSVLTFATQAAQVALAPPRIPLDRMPQDVGIAEYETVTLNTGDGVTLSGWYIPPTAEDGLAVILAHGYADNRAQLLPEARILSDQGHGVSRLSRHSLACPGSGRSAFRWAERRWPRLQRRTTG
ncbi:MAG: hypothetical protein JXA89_15135 [Anaerolineae bacterium]|nr:hypothetical protein [Anaerolineae bacterium]